jgi:S-adenosylmethionine:tRNA ribosyltransferase-isomerase
MLLSDLHYPLDETLIAQQPIEPRDHARLLCYDRKHNTSKHKHFFDLPELLDPDTVIVLNETKVMRVRIAGKTTLSDGRTRTIELILLKQIDLNRWECAVFPGERLRPGRTLFFDQEGSE